MNSKLLKLNNTTNYYHLIELCNLLLQSDLINPHIKSKVISIIYIHREEIINTVYWSNLSLITDYTLYKIYVDFHKLKNTWNYYEKCILN